MAGGGGAVIAIVVVVLLLDADSGGSGSVVAICINFSTTLVLGVTSALSLVLLGQASLLHSNAHVD